LPLYLPLWSGVSAGVTDKKSSLFSVAQTRTKLLEPGTYSLIAVEKKEIDSSDKYSDFQNYEGGKIKDPSSFFLNFKLFYLCSESQVWHKKIENFDKGFEG
jgi:hypothetical protein